MALINCPECGNQVSDKALACIHCGYPLKDYSNTVTTASQLYDVVYVGFTNNNVKNKNQASVIGQIKHILNIDGLAAVKKVLDNPPQTIIQGVNEENAEWIKQLLTPYGCNIRIEDSKSNEDNNGNLERFHHSLLLCPKCGNPDIATGQRGFSMTTGFLGSSKTTNRCGKCGYKWQP